MNYKDVNTLFLSFSWIRQFFINNGIGWIPEYLAFILETCGILYYLLIFIFFISIMIGYGRQMSSFYFFYQHIMGQKLDNPYKPALIIASMWVAVQILATGFAMGGVYFIKYGLLVTCLVFGTTTLCLLVLLVITRFLMRKMSPSSAFAKKQTTTSAAAVHPINERIVYQSQEPSVRYIQGPLETPQKQNQSDPQYIEAMLILGLKPDFSKEELQSQYRKLIKTVHADMGGSDGLYLKVKQSYEYLLGTFA